MKTPNLKTVTSQLNQRAFAHPIGRLQEIRAELHHGGSGGNIFWPASTKDDYAFHYGGRRELQFNIAWDDVVRDGQLRHGVAFSFNRNQNLTKPVEVLRHKVERFNKFMRLRPDRFGDMRMWHFNPKEDKQIHPYKPQPIPKKLQIEGVFVFLGKLQPSHRINYELILNDFDRLLELYKFTEGGHESHVISMPVQVEIRSGFKPKASAAIASQLRKQWQVILRHNKLQEALWRKLKSQFGTRNVIPEFSNVGGTRADIVVLRNNGNWFYEIKTSDSARECVREALGQILEYAFWPPATQAVSRLIIVGEAVVDEQCKKYLQVLNRRFRMPVEYQRIRVK